MKFTLIAILVVAIISVAAGNDVPNFSYATSVAATRALESSSPGNPYHEPLAALFAGDEALEKKRLQMSASNKTACRNEMYKQQVLRKGGVVDPENLVRLPLDLISGDVVKALEEAGWDPTAPTLYILEGLVYHFSTEKVVALLKSIPCVPRSRIVVSVVERSLQRAFARYGIDAWSTNYELLRSAGALRLKNYKLRQTFSTSLPNQFGLGVIVMGKKRGTCLSEKEKQVRVEEEKIFDNLKNPPVLLEGVMDLLGNEHKTDELVEQRILETNKQRVNDKKEWDHLERAAMNLDLIVKKTRKRGDHLQFSGAIFDLPQQIYKHLDRRREKILSTICFLDSRLVLPAQASLARYLKLED
ncbi:hypothetical protein FRACYDRAFT_240604 [Fragilariopsis cylindrus CCMP1102]|uniref:S-adenosyl-L-methionine-dependent methyltransferase n=1 Tax=Fragilariopsis cylindrus CCMP1102 TaxID=635003 RepID=A0A1E7FCN3_9STRA|nr:hypothetical protein FRACYDRAFT_240604 [Fragilariopsis cylindrus CCMP1102]|eukprot:OEU15909.1 hypothetical protein FRACYDRAFT_240604 [Fragilariopsis cylindrus CCMP1102]